MEVKKQEEEDEGGDSQDDVKGKMGKCHPEAKTEEKPEVRLSMLVYRHQFLYTERNYVTLCKTVSKYQS